MMRKHTASRGVRLALYSKALYLSNLFVSQHIFVSLKTSKSSLTIMTFENTENPTIEQSPQEQMVEQQIRTWEVLDTDVLDVMQNIPRENFFPERLKSFSQTDSSFQIRKDFLMPPPSVQGKILQALSIDSEDAILQLGSGSGYLTACLAELGGHVYTVGCEQTEHESIKDVCTELNIKNIGFVERPWNTMLSAIENQYDTVVSQYAYVWNESQKMNG